MKVDIILCQITSKKVKVDSFAIEIKAVETLKGSLKIDSFIRCNMIFTANKSQILQVLCKIDEEKYKQVVNKINQIISK